MKWFVIFCAAIGGGVLALVASLLVGELVRATRQSYRVATVADRLRGRRRPSLSMWFVAFKYELTTGYTSLHFGGYEIPRDLSQKIRRSR